jgi:hypothetical protein
MLVRGLWWDMDRFGGMFCILAYGLSRAIGPLLVSCDSKYEEELGRNTRLCGRRKYVSKPRGWRVEEQDEGISEIHCGRKKNGVWRRGRSELTLDRTQNLTNLSHLITLKRELFLGINLCFFRFEYRSKGEHFSVDASYGPEVCHQHISRSDMCGTSLEQRIISGKGEGTHQQRQYNA